MFLPDLFLALVSVGRYTITRERIFFKGYNRAWMRFNKALVFARLLLAHCFPAADKHGNWEHDKHGVWSVVNHRRRSMINTEARAR